MKVTFVRVPTIIDASASTAPITPPLGLAYLKRVVTGFTDDVGIVDSIGNDPSTRVVELGGRQFKLMGQSATQIAGAVHPDTQVILLSIMFSQDWPYAREVIRRFGPAVRRLCSWQREHISALARYSMEVAPELDMCVLGEGEGTLQALLEAVSAGPRPAQRPPPGPCSGSRAGRSARTPVDPASARSTASTGPTGTGSPSRSTSPGVTGSGSTAAAASRCSPRGDVRSQCAFCSSPQMWTTLWKARDPHDVLAEMRGLCGALPGRQLRLLRPDRDRQEELDRRVLPPAHRERS